MTISIFRQGMNSSDLIYHKQWHDLSKKGKVLFLEEILKDISRLKNLPSIKIQLSLNQPDDTTLPVSYAKFSIFLFQNEELVSFSNLKLLSLINKSEKKVSESNSNLQEKSQKPKKKINEGSLDKSINIFIFSFSNRRKKESVINNESSNVLSVQSLSSILSKISKFRVFKTSIDIKTKKNNSIGRSSSSFLSILDSRKSTMPLISTGGQTIKSSNFSKGNGTRLMQKKNKKKKVTIVFSRANSNSRISKKYLPKLVHRTSNKGLSSNSKTENSVRSNFSMDQRKKKLFYNFQEDSRGKQIPKNLIQDSGMGKGIGKGQKRSNVDFVGEYYKKKGNKLGNSHRKQLQDIFSSKKVNRKY